MPTHRITLTTEPDISDYLAAETMAHVVDGLDTQGYPATFTVETDDDTETPDVDVDTMAGWEQAAGALDAIAELLRDTDWSGVLYDGDVIRAIADAVRTTGRDPGPDQDTSDADNLDGPGELLAADEYCDYCESTGHTFRTCPKRDDV